MWPISFAHADFLRLSCIAIGNPAFICEILPQSYYASEQWVRKKATDLEWNFYASILLESFPHAPGAIVLSRHILLAAIASISFHPLHPHPHPHRRRIPKFNLSFALYSTILCCTFFSRLSSLKHPFSFTSHSSHCASSVVIPSDVCSCCVHVKIHWSKYFILKSTSRGKKFSFPNVW